MAFNVYTASTQSMGSLADSLCNSTQLNGLEITDSDATNCSTSSEIEKIPQIPANDKVKNFLDHHDFDLKHSRQLFDDSEESPILISEINTSNEQSKDVRGSSFIDTNSVEQNESVTISATSNEEDEVYIVSDSDDEKANEEDFLNVSSIQSKDNVDTSNSTANRDAFFDIIPPTRNPVSIDDINNSANIDGCSAAQKLNQDKSSVESSVKQNNSDSNRLSDKSKESKTNSSKTVPETRTSSAASSLDDLTKCIQDINISATFNIKLRVCQTSRTYESDIEEDEEEDKVLNSATPSVGNSDGVEVKGSNTTLVSDNNGSDSSSCKLSPLSSYENESSGNSETNDEDVVSDSDFDVDKVHDLLSRVYGNEWRTPKVLRTIEKKSAAKSKKKLFLSTQKKRNIETFPENRSKTVRQTKVKFSNTNTCLDNKAIVSDKENDPLSIETNIKTGSILKKRNEPIQRGFKKKLFDTVRKKPDNRRFSESENEFDHVKKLTISSQSSSDDENNRLETDSSAKNKIKRKLFTVDFGDEIEVPSQSLLVSPPDSLTKHKEKEEISSSKLKHIMPNLLSNLKLNADPGKKDNFSTADEHNVNKYLKLYPSKYSFLKSLDVSLSRKLCHPDAVIYRESYKTKKEELSQILYNIYNEKIFDGKLATEIVWNKKLQTTAGRCCNSRKGLIRSSTVELSEKVLTGPDRLASTLIHELCHAATWIFNGEKTGHGATWKKWATKSNRIFDELPRITVCHQYDIEYKYTYVCKQCKAKSHAHSKSVKAEKIRCSYCHGSIEILLNKKLKNGEIVVAPVRKASGFSKFVQEKYKNFSGGERNHSAIMKKLGEAYALLTDEEKKKYSS